MPKEGGGGWANSNLQIMVLCGQVVFPPTLWKMKWACETNRDTCSMWVSSASSVGICSMCSKNVCVCSRGVCVYVCVVCG